MLSIYLFPVAYKQIHFLINGKLPFIFFNDVKLAAYVNILSFS